MKWPYPLHLKHCGGHSQVLDRLLSMEGDRPRGSSRGLSLFWLLGWSLGLAVVPRSAIHTLGGPAVGGQHLGSWLWSSRNSANICSTIRDGSESDPHSLVNPAWVVPLLDRPLPISLSSTTSKEHAICIKSSSRLAQVVATCTRTCSLWLSRPVRNWSVTIFSRAKGCSRG